MTSPGGQEVGRVSIRVLPDSSGFRAKLRKDLADETAGVEAKIEVEPDLQNFQAKIRAELAKIASESAKIDIEPNLQSQALRARLQAMVAEASAGIRAEVEVEWVPAVRILRTRLQAIVLAASRGVNVRVEVDYDRSQLDQFRNSIGKIGSGGSGGSILDLIPNMITRWASIIGLLSPLLIIAGAAITEAWGILATLIATIPGLVFAIGSAVGVVVLGIDGIQKAFEKLNPTLDRIKTKVSAAFEEGLVGPVALLDVVLKDLEKTKILEGVAGNISKIALALSRTIWTYEREIFTLIANTGVRLEGAADDFASILATSIKVASDPRALDAFFNFFETFAVEYKIAVKDLTSDGTLGGAFEGLDRLLQQITRGFVHLVTNGIKVFNNATPGVSLFFQKLTDFFDRFDWDALGKSVGQVFDGIAETLDKITPEQIKSIEDAFAALGMVFQDEGLQNSFRNMLDLIPFIILLFAALTEAIGRTGSVLVGLGKMFGGWALGVIGVMQLLAGDVDGAARSFAASRDMFVDGASDIKDAFTVGFGGAQKAVDGAGKFIEKKKVDFKRDTDEIKKSIDNGLKPGDKDYAGPWDEKTKQIDTAVGNGMKKVQATGQAGADVVARSIGPDGVTNDEMDNKWYAFVLGIGTIINEAFGGLPQIIAPAVKNLGTFISTTLGLTVPETEKALQPIPRVIGEQLGKGAGEVTRTTGQSVTALRNGLAPMGPAASQAGANANAEMAKGMGSLNRTVDTGAAQAVGRFRPVPGQVQGAMGPTGSVLTASGEGFMQGLLRGIISAAQAVYDYVSGIAARIRALKGPLPYDRTVLIDNGMALMFGLQKGLEAGFENVLDDVRTYAGRIGDEFSNNPIDATFNASVNGMPAPGALSGFSSSLAAAVDNDGFGVDYQSLAGAVVEGMTGSKLMVDGDGVAKLVNKSNTRKAARR